MDSRYITTGLLQNIKCYLKNLKLRSLSISNLFEKLKTKIKETIADTKQEKKTKQKETKTLFSFITDNFS